MAEDQREDEEGSGEEAAAAAAGADESETGAAGAPEPGAVSSDAVDPAAAEASGDTEESPEARLEAQLQEAQDQVLRAQAEIQNTRRRAEQDVERARKYALERFAGELLPVVDNLERALDAAEIGDEQVKPIAEGVELTLKNFFSVLAKFHIEPVDPQGEPFDPQLHQAMSSVENGEVEPNTVVAVMQKGYTLNGRLVRPAMVMVSKPVSAEDSG